MGGGSIWPKGQDATLLCPLKNKEVGFQGNCFKEGDSGVGLAEVQALFGVFWVVLDIMGKACLNFLCVLLLKIVVLTLDQKSKMGIQT